jgi:hypothetical protein
MKNKVASYCFFFCVFNFLVMYTPFLQAQTWDWGRQVEGLTYTEGSDYGGTAGTDKYGNVFMSGNYFDTILFGTDTLREPNRVTVYSVKYDSNGNLIWAVQAMLGRNDLNSGAIEITNHTDNSGNVYVTGYFYDTLYFGSYKIVSYVLRSPNPFLVKYNSNGIPQWAVNVLPYPEGIAYSIATDNLNNVFIAGDSAGTGGRIFISKYNPNGVQLWTLTSGEILTSRLGSVARSVCTDKLGNSYVTGCFYQGSVIFGKDTLTTSIGNNTYLVKYDSAGNFQWAKQPKGKAGTDSINAFSYSYAVASDYAGNIYLSGWFCDTLVFGSYTLTALPSTSDSVSMFLVKYDSHGNVIWAKAAPANYLSVPTALATDTLNHIYLGGNGKSDIKFGNLVLHPESSSTYNSFLIEFDTTGKVLCGSLLNNGSGDQYLPGPGIASDYSGKYVYLGGANHVGETMICGPDTITATIVSGNDPYIARWIPCNYVNEGINEVKERSEKVKVYPNPSTGIFTITLAGVQNPDSYRDELVTIEIYNVLGEQVLTELRQPADDNLIDISNQPNGIYFYRVTSPNGELIGEGKVIVSK